MKKLILILSIILSGNAVFAQDTVMRPGRSYSPDSEGNMVAGPEEDDPRFPGGTPALIDYISKNLRYPKEARGKNIQGKVILRFVVKRTGKVEDIIIIKDIGAGCAEEAVRVVKAMPDWIPAKQNGQTVNTFFTLPVNFELSK
jgi:TonB family protein